MKLVIYPPIDAERLAGVEQAAGAMQVINADCLEETLAHITDAEAFFGKMTPQILAQAEQLQWVQSPTASLEHFLFPELIAHPCQVTNMRAIFNDVIADHVFSYILCFARNLHCYLRQQQEHQWAPIGGESARASFAQGPGHVTGMDRAHMHLSDTTLGIVGLGGIGLEVARRGNAFGMRVLGVDPEVTSPPAGIEAIWQPGELHELLKQSDFVVIAAPHTPHTERMFQTPQFQQMKRESYLINIGRGAIVALDDLVAALADGTIAGAALDVFETEPLPAAHPLWAMENVLITPHVAACSVRISERHLEVLLDNVSRFADGQPLRNVANKQLWY